MIVVAKIGTSSLTDDAGVIDEAAIERFCAEVAGARDDGHEVVVVTSGAIAAGIPALGLAERPSDMVTLQAASAVGQSLLMKVYDRYFAAHGFVTGQVLLAPFDFFERTQYLHARRTLIRLLSLGVVPVINENDAIADDAIRFGDNDRIAALVAHLVGADLLVLLTDTPGLLTADPRVDETASLIEEIQEVDKDLEALAGGAGTTRGSGGMASKLAAAKIASWSGVRTVIGAADRRAVLTDAIVAAPGVGTVVQPRSARLSARKLWIAFAVPSRGTIVVDAGARNALTERNTSLLAVGVVRVDGDFNAGDAVEISSSEGEVFAKGLTRMAASSLRSAAGKRTADLAAGQPAEVLHRDELVLVP